MFENKLIALDFYATDKFEYLDEKVFRNFISWLENQKIRLYTIEDRQPLDQVESSEWPVAFEKYLTDLQLRGLNGQTERDIQIEKLLAHAIRLEYSDNPDTYRDHFKREQETQASTKDQTNPLEKLDYTSEEFKSGLSRVQQVLSVCSKAADTTSVLQAVSELVESRLSAEAVQASGRHTKHQKEVNAIQLVLDNIDLGFDTKDKTVNDAAKILRLLHIKELRELQTQINEAIVCIQAITANPKTDTKLGKVGR